MIWMSGAYWEYYLMGIILLPGIIFAIIAQARVTKSFNKYSKIMSSRGITGADLARQILDEADLGHIRVERSRGTLSDHYDHRRQKVALSDAVYSSSSLAALGVAAHEVGHALQYKENYTPVKARGVLVPFTNAVSNMLWPLVFLGLILNFGAGTTFGLVFVYAGIVWFSCSFKLCNFTRWV